MKIQRRHWQGSADREKIRLLDCGDPISETGSGLRFAERVYGRLQVDGQDVALDGSYCYYRGHRDLAAAAAAADYSYHEISGCFHVVVAVDGAEIFFALLVRYYEPIFGVCSGDRWTEV